MGFAATRATAAATVEAARATEPTVLAPIRPLRGASIVTAIAIAFVACGSRTSLPTDLASQPLEDASVDAADDHVDADAASDAHDALEDAPVCIKPVTCGPRTCPDGCCAGATCIRGDEAARCGANGEACADCVRGQYDGCDPTRHACVKKVDSCSRCGGCCDQALRCFAPNSSAACGNGSASCGPCAQGKLCVGNGICLSPCGIDTCPSGCCQNGDCVLGTADERCGGFGEGCRDCTRRDSDRCLDQHCVTDVPQCDVASCPSGCCALVGRKTSCIDGISARACGTAARACQDCVAAGLVCDLVTHTCQQPVCSR